MRPMSISDGMLLRWMVRMYAEGMRYCPERNVYLEEKLRNGVGMFATPETLEHLVELGHVEILEEDGVKVARASASALERARAEARDLP